MKHYSFKDRLGWFDSPRFAHEQSHFLARINLNDHKILFTKI